MKNTNKKAFTLAEVLVTLGIIGVVAVLTVPNVISSYQKKVYVVQLQKAYNQLQQVFSLAMAEDEVEYLADTELMQSIENDCIGQTQWATDSEFVAQLGKYLKITKFCSHEDFSNGCHDISYLNKDTESETPFGLQIFTQDGMIYYFEDNFCKKVYSVPKAYSFLTCDEIKSSGGNVCFSHIIEEDKGILVDINGRKGPNKMGRDLFRLIVDEKGSVYPYGSVSVFGKFAYWEHIWQYGCYNGGVHFSNDGCAGRIFDEGWQMNY